MVLFSFSHPSHIPLILSGQKAQTTRQPRKPRKNGKKPYSVGEKAQLYYRSRQKASCHNCLKRFIKYCDFYNHTNSYPGAYFCSNHSNFFGESVITEIVHYWNDPIAHFATPTESDFCSPCEYWYKQTIGDLPKAMKESWAILDGFAKGFTEAHEFFYGETADSEWMYKDLDVIKWNGQQIARRVA